VKALVVAGGRPDDADLAQLETADLVIAADAGAHWLVAHGRRPDLLVGDLDSIEASLVEELAAAGTQVERHPSEKDASDAELALERAVAVGADRVVLVGALGGPRLDHELANLLLLADSIWDRELDELRIVRGTTVVRAARPARPLRLEAGPGSTVTLIPVGGDAEGVVTTGLRYALSGDRLRLGRSRGLSNVVEQPPASVTVGKGSLLVIETPPEGGEEP
jgi:thiamine pyrophosphokinase